MKMPVGDAFWGKLHPAGGEAPYTDWHPLEDHCADVAACAVALLELPLLRRRLARLGGLDDLTEVQVERLGVLAALHDIGKYNQGFQAKQHGREGITGHVSEGIALLCNHTEDRTKAFAALEVETLATWADDPGTMLALWIASISHHGTPVQRDVAHLRDWWRARRGLDPFTGLRALATKTKAWMPRAWEAGGAMLPSAAPFQHGFAGLVMLADWLGSDTSFFRYTEEGDDDRRFARSREVAREVLRHMGLDPSDARATLSGDDVWRERVMDGRSLRPAQATVHALPTAPREGSVTVLESETGSGKTEAALLRYLRLFGAGLVDGMYLALPTRTAATQIHARVVKAVERVWGDVDEDRRPPVLLAVPGYLAVDDVRGRRLAPFEVLWHDDPRDRMRFRGWAAENSKRYLAGAIVVGTIDQCLLATLKVPHAHLRGTALLRHLLVVDEVHASDAYMGRVLEELLRWHLGAGGHAFLMSATLGAAMRDRIVAAAERPSVPFHPDDVTPIAEARALPYPSVLHTSSGGRAAPVTAGDAGLPREVQLVPKGIVDDPEAIAREALEAARSGARVLVVRNTVKDCVRTQAALESLLASDADHALCLAVGERLAPHHARYARSDRGLLDLEIERRFGAGSTAGACVAIATQTVQQSLDLDADLMLTDLCPMDVLLQRVGRLHRNPSPPRTRPQAFRAACAVVLVPAARDLSPYLREHGGPKERHGFGYVYADLRVLEATWRQIGDGLRVSIPSMNRQLVEDTTHPAALRAVVASLGDVWRAHATEVEGAGLADRRVGQLNAIPRATPFGELVFPDRRTDERITTRLGEDDRRVVFEPPQPGPFGKLVYELRLPAWMARGAGDEPTTTVLEADGAQVLFAYGARRYVYDRLGLRAEEVEA